MSGTAYGQQTAQSGQSHVNATVFAVQQLLAKVNTATLVQVLAVTNAGGISPVGYVDVQPMVNQIDGAGNAVPHGTIHSLPYMRLQGGANAVILDPAIGDIGLAVFASRDISAVKAGGAVANPGSFRRFDMSDGCYIGGFLNAAPTQYVQFNASGITLVSPGTVTIQAPNIALNGNVTSTGTFANNGHSIGSTHTHTNVSTGTGVSGPPS